MVLPPLYFPHLRLLHHFAGFLSRPTKRRKARQTGHRKNAPPAAPVWFLPTPGGPQNRRCMRRWANATASGWPSAEQVFCPMTSDRFADQTLGQRRVPRPPVPLRHDWADRRQINHSWVRSIFIQLIDRSRALKPRVQSIAYLTNHGTISSF